MRELPDKIKIFHKEFKIEKREASLEWNNAGQIKHAQDVMMICTKNENGETTLAEQWQTLFHEIIHGIKTMLSIDDSEEDTDRLALGIFTVLSDNELLK